MVHGDWFGPKHYQISVPNTSNDNPRLIPTDRIVYSDRCSYDVHTYTVHRRTTGQLGFAYVYMFDGIRPEALECYANEAGVPELIEKVVVLE